MKLFEQIIRPRYVLNIKEFENKNQQNYTGDTNLSPNMLLVIARHFTRAETVFACNCSKSNCKNGR